jgi:lipopolysaccharide biosynthesis regulator YciM
MVHTHRKDYITKAIKMLTDLLKGNSEYIPAIVCLATCKFMAKKSSDAKNLLMKMKNMNYLPEYAEEFETWWLLLSDYFISNNKRVEAEDLLTRCLTLNKSVVKAEELMGVIREKENNYMKSAEHYK